MNKYYEYLVGFIAWLGVYFNPTFSMILIVGFFIMSDTILGILAARKLGTLDHKVSRKFRPALDKFIGYGIVVLVAHVIETRFLPDFPALKVISGYLMFIELKSMDENFKVIAGISIFSSIIKKIKPAK